MNLKGAKVVARYVDGRLLKGYTFDFEPHRLRFHVFPDLGASREPRVVMMRELKAVFFVRDLVGDAQYQEQRQLTGSDPAAGRRVEVTFADGEVLMGVVAEEPDPRAPGLLFLPVDPRSNNLRVYAVASAVRRVRHLASERPVGRLAPATRGAWGPLLPRPLLAWLDSRLTP